MNLQNPDASEEDGGEVEVLRTLPLKSRAPFSFMGALKEIALYAGIFLSALVLFLTIKPLYGFERNGVVAQAIEAAAIGACLFVGGFLAFNKKLTAQRLVLLLFIMGVALRMGYMLYTPANTRQYDTFTKNFDGHEAYAWTLFSTGKLPAKNIYQFYHPPLNALLQAGFMHFMSGLTDALTSVFSLGSYFPDKFLAAKPEYLEAERYFLFQSCQILSLMYSVAVCRISLKILKRLNIGGNAYVGLAAFLIFFPRNIQFAGALNNDAVSYLCGIAALYFALSWWKGAKDFLNILFCSLFVGLGMMAKLSSATICLPIAGIFIWEFVRTLIKKDGSLSLPKMIGEYGAFLLLCIPLGLWFQVYAKIRFDQPFGFVFSNLNQKLYTGNHSFFGRFFIAFDANEYFGSLYCRPFSFHYNLFNYALRSAIFGEFSYWQGEGLAVSAVVLAYIACLVLFVALIRAVYLFFRYDRKKSGEGAMEERRNVFFVFLLVQSQALSEIYFYIKMPYGCTMDFRYIMPMILGIALTVWLVNGRLVKEGGKLSLALSRLTVVSFGLAMLFSSLFYMVCI